MQTDTHFPATRKTPRPFRLVHIFRLPSASDLEPTLELECRLTDDGVVIFSGSNEQLAENLRSDGLESPLDGSQVFPRDGEKFLAALIARPFGYNYAVPVID